MISAEIINAVDGVEAEGVHVIFGEPVKCIVDYPAAHSVAIGSIKVDGLAPWSLIGVSETGSVLRKIVPFRTEVVVHHIHDDGEAAGVAGVDKLFQSFRTAVCRLRRVQAGTVVSPITTSRKFRNRHDFDGGDADVAEIGQPGNYAFECAFGCEGAGVKFVDDQVF